MNSIAVFSLLFAVYLASAFNLPEQGDSTLQQRIIGGQPAGVDEFPHQVAIGNLNSHMIYSGALIQDHWVLTAASIMLSLSEIEVRLGMVHQDHVKYAYTFVVPRGNVFSHGSFEGGTTANIALIKIPHVDFSSRIQPAILPQRQAFYLNTNAIVSGWGVTTPFGPNADTLQHVTLKIISNADCSESYGITIHQELLCTLKSGRGLCQFDIGAPLITETTKILIGIAVFFRSCDEEYPDGFVRVDHYLDWIHGTIRRHSS